MGFFDFIFGKKDKDIQVIVTHTSTVTEVAESKANKLAKEATQLKKEGKYEEALAKFLVALDTRGSEEFSIQMRLRLPMYYQLAGRRDDSWSVYQDLSHRYLSPFEQAPIYDKMRLQLQREKSYMGAIPYGIFSFIMGTQGHQQLVNQTLQMIDEHKQMDLDTKTVQEMLKDDMERMSNNYSKESVANMLEPLLKKAKMENIQEPLIKGIIAIGDEIQFNEYKAHYLEVHDLCKAVYIEYGYLKNIG